MDRNKEQDESSDEIKTGQTGPLNFEVEDGIYEAGELVDKFRKILVRMNKADNATNQDPNAESQLIQFPYNELYKTSPYSEIYDWEKYLQPEDAEQLFS